MSLTTASGSGLGRPIAPWLVLSLAIGTQAFAVDEVAPTHVIRTAAEVRSLTSAQASQHYPVQLRGVVTFFDEALFCNFVQDDTAGIYLQQTNLPPLRPGQLVEIEGVTSAGEFAPVVTPQRVTALGTGVFPPPQPVSFEQLTSGAEDSQFVQIQGIVRDFGVDPQTRYYSI